ncbi:MAG: flagellar hook-associated protein FlgK [bacterium]|nr:flagellar hook-associated protein FlgK [bacterium]
MSLFGYFQIGLQSMNVSRLGLQVAGDNMANVFTPGYARRRLELTPGIPQAIQGGMIDQGVDVARLRRMEDRFLQSSLEREHGRHAGQEELLRGLSQVETLFGPLEGVGSLSSALAGFSTAFDELAVQPENGAQRRAAIAAADGLAQSIRGTYQRLQEQRGAEEQAIRSTIGQVNTLAGELAKLNQEIVIEEAAGGVAAPLRDRRTIVVEELAELTGGVAVSGSRGQMSFSLPNGPTLVADDTALPLQTDVAVDGTVRVLSSSDGADITNRLRQGRLGARLQLRDDVLAARMTDLDTLADSLAVEANALTTSATDLQGDPGIPLFLSGGAAGFAVDPRLLDDPGLLAVSDTGAPGNGDIARQLAGLPDLSTAALGGKSARSFVSDLRTALGHELAEADVANGVSRSLIESMEAQRDSISGVSLDEEATELIKFQRSFEAAARFIDVMNSITEVAVNLVGR